MNTEEINRFDELMREKLNSYQESEPDMDLFSGIQSRKNRFLRLKNLYTLIFLLAIVSAGIVGGFLLTTKPNNQSQLPNKNELAKPTNGKGTTGDAMRKKQKPASIININPEIENANSVDISINNGIVYNVNAEKTNSTLSIIIDNDNLNNNTVLATNTINNHQELVQNEKQIQKENDKQPLKSKEITGCNVDIDYYTSYDNGFNFIAKTQNQNVQLTWQFGDGKTSKDINPKHIYQKAGQYAVTLTAIDKITKCKAETYKLVSVTKGVDLTASTISGTVFADAEFAAKTLVELWVRNIKTNQYEAYQAAYTNNNGYYEFDEVGEGNYLIKTSSYKLYSATYYGNTTDKEYANNLAIFANDYKHLIGYDIQMINHQQNTSIYKNTSDSGSKWMIVLDGNNNPIASVLVNANGTVQSNSTLPQGEYNLMDPTTGITSGKINVNKNETSLSESSNNNAKNDLTSTQQELVLMPNPAIDNVKVSLSPSNNTPIEVSIVNYQGALMQSFTLSSGTNVNSINISWLPVGTYYVVAKQNGKTTSTRLVKTIDSSK
ncbi:MAG: T9SS type A sorting domain-containing protein [Bacteroidia bacterium]|nr:T9SS type A sorting domain-containing protein [Bacteroidia bacterium]MBP9689282.1 T9SS type A sorting domain-containing protein [Bacteroidia bacterium]